MPRKAVQFSIALDNNAGTLANLCATLRKARVNIAAISVTDNAECGWVRMIAEPPDRARAALEKAKYQVCPQLVAVVDAADSPGGLEAIAARLSKARVNINYVYGSRGAGAALLVLGVSNVTAAVKALSRGA